MLTSFVDKELNEKNKSKIHFINKNDLKDKDDYISEIIKYSDEE